MKFCQPHWESLRTAIRARGLEALVADSGEKAGANMASELQDGSSIDNFDPLMAAHWAIVSNAMKLVHTRYVQDPLLLMAEHPEQPELNCPICALNSLHAEHDRLCHREDCDYPRGETYEWMIDRAADSALETWKSLGSGTA